MTQDEAYDGLLLRLEAVRSTFSKHEGRKSSLETLLVTYIAEYDEARALDLSYAKLQKFFQAIGSQEQENLQRWFEEAVTYGLVAVFGKYEFVIKGPEVKGNDIATGFMVLERIGDNDFQRDPYEEMGGGIADVLSFLLQFLMVYLLRDRIQPIIFMDEAFKHLATIYRPRMASLLGSLASKIPVQIVLITHDQIFTDEADVVYRYSKPLMATVVERIK